jgi:hypothetical protein
MNYFTRSLRTLASLKNPRKITRALIVALTLHTILLFSSENASAQAASSWTYCASEGGQCNFSGTMQVRYGNRGFYVSSTFTNGVACNNDVFGDPLVGFGKVCEYSSDSTSTQTRPSTPTTITGNGNIYYVGTYGNNANSCTAATNINSPKRTITGASGGLACLATAKGDRLEIRGGTYVENITSSTQSMPSGTDWDNAAIITGYSGETVTIAPTNGGSAIAMEKAQYIAFANLVIDGSNNPNTGDGAIWFGTTRASAPAHHLLFQNIEVKNWYGSNMEAFGDFSEILDSSFHDNRRSSGYGIYVQGHDNVFESNTIYNHGGFGVHNYCSGCASDQGPSRNVYRFNEIYNTGYDLVNSPAALLLHSGDGIQAYGNNIHDNAYIGIDANGTNTTVYNNTVIRNLYDIIGF